MLLCLKHVLSFGWMKVEKKREKRKMGNDIDLRVRLLITSRRSVYLTDPCIIVAHVALALASRSRCNTLRLKVPKDLNMYLVIGFDSLTVDNSSKCNLGWLRAGSIGTLVNIRSLLARDVLSEL